MSGVDGAGYETFEAWRWYREEINNHLRSVRVARKYLIEHLNGTVNRTVPSLVQVGGAVKRSSDCIVNLMKKLKHRLDLTFEYISGDYDHVVKKTLQTVSNELRLDAKADQGGLVLNPYSLSGRLSFRPKHSWTSSARAEKFWLKTAQDLK